MVKAETSQRSVLGPLFSLILINNPSDNLVSNAKLFVDANSLSFSGCPGYPFISKEFK